MVARAKSPAKKPQLLHLVLGGELTNVEEIEFKDLKALDIVGIYPDYDSAHKAWSAAARQTSIRPSTSAR